MITSPLAETTTLYRPSAIKPTQRKRRNKAEIAELEAAIYDIAQTEQPCTIRGVYYRVVGRDLTPKTENGYKQVQSRILLMRRSGALPYRWIADGTRYRVRPTTYSSIDDALDSAASSYRRALWDNQRVHVELWTEKHAITSVIQSETSKWDVPIYVARGYCSETFAYTTAQEIIADNKPAVIYQLGDHDPSGVGSWDDIQQKLTRFAPRIDFTFERLAVTPEQIEEFNLPTRATKKSDTRAASFVGESVEVDTIPSPTLRRLVREAIERQLDPEPLRLTKMAEDEERRLMYRIANLDWENWGQ